jgi:hypothetical protein
MFVHNYFCKANRIKSCTNPSLIPQNLFNTNQKLFQDFLNQNPILGSMGSKGLITHLNKRLIDTKDHGIFYIFLFWFLLYISKLVDFVNVQYEKEWTIDF